jgi:hypothetical protein
MRATVWGAVTALMLDKTTIPMAYTEAAEAATKSAESDSENFRRRVAFQRRRTEIGDPTAESNKSTAP